MMFKQQYFEWDDFWFVKIIVEVNGFVGVAEKLGVNYFMVFWWFGQMEENFGVKFFEWYWIGYVFIMAGEEMMVLVEQMEENVMVFICKFVGQVVVFVGELWVIINDILFVYLLMFIFVCFIMVCLEMWFDVVFVNQVFNFLKCDVDVVIWVMDDFFEMLVGW